MEQAGVETEVQLLGSLPGDVRIRELIGIGAGTRSGGGRTGIEGVTAVSSTHGDRGEILEIGDVAVTVLTPASAELQEVDGADVPPRLVGDHPTGGDGREGTPSVTAHEVGGTVPTENQGEHVLLGVVVVDTAEEGCETAVTPGGTAHIILTGIAGRVADIGILPQVGPEDLAVGSVHAFTEAAVLEGATHEGVEMVLVCEVEHVVDRVFPGPAPAGGSALADTVGIQERVVGKLVHHRIVAVSARTHPIIELALPGEAFDGLHTEVSGQGKAVAVAVVVTAAGIGHRSNRIAGIGIQRPDTAVAQPVILGVRTVRLVDGHKRVRGQHIVHVVPVVVAGTDAAVGRLGEGLSLQSTWSEFRRTVKRL